MLKNAPHTAAAVIGERLDAPYSREQAAFPLPFVRERKFWPSVGRIDNPYGDRNLFCAARQPARSVRLQPDVRLKADATQIKRFRALDWSADPIICPFQGSP